MDSVDTEQYLEQIYDRCAGAISDRILILNLKKNTIDQITINFQTSIFNRFLNWMK